MDNSLTVSPLSNVLPPDLFSGFVGRKRELQQIQDAFDRGARGVLILGTGGAGKTSLARVFAARFERESGRHSIITSASWAESFEHLLRRVLSAQPEGPNLLVIDDAEAFDEHAISELPKLADQSPAVRMILTSRRALRLPHDFQTLPLGGLNRDEFEELLRLRNAVVHGSLSQALVQRLFEFADGNALFADLASSAVQTGTVATWRELFEYVRGFRTSGIVGTDGRPLAETSRDYKRLVVSVSDVNAEILALLKREPELTRRLDPRKFEEIVADILAKQGYEVTLTPASGDGGFDMYAARKDGLGKFLYLVECKRYASSNKVGVEVARALYGVVQTQRATAGAIVTTSFFTAGAEKFRREVQHQLHLHDYIALQKWIADFPLQRDGSNT